MGGLVSLSARSAATPEALARQIQARLAALTRAQDLTRPSMLDSESNAWAVDDFSLTGARDLCALSRLGGIHRSRTPDRQRTRRADRRKVSDGPRPAAARTRNECGQVWLPVIRKGLRPHRLVYIEQPISCDMGGKGGPPLKEAPQHEGFGSLLTRRIVNGQLGGQLLYDWKPEGLVVRLSVPLERLTKIERFLQSN